MKNRNYIFSVTITTIACLVMVMMIYSPVSAQGTKYQCVDDSSGSIKKPVCLAGFSLNDAQNLCIKPAQSARTEYLGRPSGKWTPFTKPSNYKYTGSKGGDYFSHKRNNRKTVGIKCNAGKLRFDANRAGYWPNYDWCVIDHKYTPEQTLPAACSSKNSNLVEQSSPQQPVTGYADLSDKELVEIAVKPYRRQTNGKYYPKMIWDKQTSCVLGERTFKNVAYVSNSVNKKKSSEYKLATASYSASNWAIMSAEIITTGGNKKHKEEIIRKQYNGTPTMPKVGTLKKELENLIIAANIPQRQKVHLYYEVKGHVDALAKGAQELQGKSWGPWSSVTLSSKVYGNGRHSNVRSWFDGHLNVELACIPQNLDFSDYDSLYKQMHAWTQTALTDLKGLNAKRDAEISKRNSANAINGQILSGQVLLGQGQILSEKKLTASITMLESAQWSKWLDRDRPGGSGDYEPLAKHVGDGAVCAAPTAVECRVAGEEISYEKAGEVYSCTIDKGGRCRNDEQPDGKCKNYEVRFLCPVP